MPGADQRKPALPGSQGTNGEAKLATQVAGRRPRPIATIQLEAWSVLWLITATGKPGHEQRVLGFGDSGRRALKSGDRIFATGQVGDVHETVGPEILAHDDAGVISQLVRIGDSGCIVTDADGQCSRLTQVAGATDEIRKSLARNTHENPMKMERRERGDRRKPFQGQFVGKVSLNLVDDAIDAPLILTSMR